MESPLQTVRSNPLQGAYGNKMNHGGAFPLPLAGEGQGGGVLPLTQGMRSDTPLPASPRLRGEGQFSPAQMQKMDAAAQDFEAVFISQMLEHMFDGVETNEMFGGGEAEDIYRSMMIDEYGKMMSKTGGIGLADHVKRQLLTLQETE